MTDRINEIRQHAEEIQALQEAATESDEVVYDNDTGPDDGGYWEWWTSGSGKFDDKEGADFYHAARNSTLPAEAKWLCEEVERLRAADVLLRKVIALNNYSEMVRLLPELKAYLKRAADATGGE